jgi:hypothetical protein
MHQSQLTGVEQPTLKTLASARSDGDNLEIVENQDGSVAIQLEGEEMPHYRWEAGRIEECINAYMRLLRR